jgi:hypothetical protein
MPLAKSGPVSSVLCAISGYLFSRRRAAITSMPAINAQTAMMHIPAAVDPLRVLIE